MKCSDVKIMKREISKLRLELDKKELELDNRALRLENEKLKNALSATNTNSKTVQNVTINGNVTNNTNNITNNVIVNVYGKENLKHITPEMVQYCIKKGKKGDVLMFKYKHLDVPENNNIKIKNNKILALKSHKNGQEQWDFIAEADFIRDCLFETYKLYLANMRKRGKPNVTKQEVSHLNEVNAPTSQYKESVKEGIFNLF